MSRFVNMTKSLGAYLSRALTSKVGAVYETSQMSSGFSRWRNNYERICKRKERQRYAMRKNTSSHYLEPKLGPSECFINSLKRRRSAMRFRFDQVGLNIASMLSGMRMARLLSIHSHQTPSAMPPIFGQSIRTKCGRENCADPCDFPVCPPGNKTFYRPRNKLFNIYEAYWEEKNDNCCEDICKWANTRFDDIYLRETDKRKRIYQRTWYECPVRVITKRACCFDQGTPPEICKRAKSERPPTACMPECSEGHPKCPRITLPCCCPVRKKLTCKPITRGLQDCKRFCAPYPSFSECVKKRPRPLRPRECDCLRMPMKCELYEYYRHRFPHWTVGCS